MSGVSVTTTPATITISAENADNNEPVTFTFLVNVRRPPATWVNSGIGDFGGLKTDGQDADGVEDLAYGNGVWVAGGRITTPTPGPVIRYSKDGKTWLGGGPAPGAGEEDTRIIFAGAGPGTAIRSVFFDGTRFIAGDGGGNILTSINGKDWTAPVATGLGGAMGNISYGGGKYIVAAIASTNRFAWSDDLVTWSAPNPATGGTGSIMTSSAYGNVNGVDTWVFVGRAAGGFSQVRVTNDFETFINNETGPITGLPSVNLTSVAFGNGRFVAVGQTGTVIHSTNGLSWTPAATSFGNTGQNTVVFINGYFVVGGDTNNVRYSPDGITWTAANPSGNTNINPHVRSITFGNNVWLAGTRGGTLYYSEVAP